MNDIEAIKQLKARYFRTMDTKDWSAMREQFCDDIRMDSSDSGGDILEGADTCIDFLKSALADVLTVPTGTCLRSR